MLAFSPLFAAVCKQNKPLAKADVHPRWMEGAVKVLGGGQRRGGGLYRSQCLLSDVNPADWCDRKLLDFRGKQSSNPGLKTKYAAALNEDQMWRREQADGDLLVIRRPQCLPEPPQPPRRRHAMPSTSCIKETLMDVDLASFLFSPPSVFVFVIFWGEKSDETVCW